MRKFLWLLTFAFVAFGCSSNSNSDRNVMGPNLKATLSGALADATDPNCRHDGNNDDADNGGTGGGGAGSALLKGAAGFSVFAASTITSTGPSVVNGDIGLTPGTSVTGFPPGTFTGTLHINDAATAQAKLDLQAAFDDLVGRPCTTVAPNLDSTLGPGVYCFSSSAQLNTALVLDGHGNPNALFIFQIGSTLTTASNSTVTLINGASAGNVFWVVGSSATLGTNTAFQGTIIAYASITMTTGASLTNGRAMALTAAVTLDSNSITNPGGGTGGGGGGHGKDCKDGKHGKDCKDGKHGKKRGHDRDDDHADRGRGHRGNGGHSD